MEWWQWILVTGLPAIIAAVTVAFVKIAPALQRFLDARSAALETRKVAADVRRRSSLGEYQEIVERLQKTTDRQQIQIDDQQHTINQLVLANATCRAVTQSMYNSLVLFRNTMKRYCKALQDAKISCEEPPDIPDISHWDEGMAEYLQRTTQQNTDLLRKEKRESDANSQDVPPELRRPEAGNEGKNSAD